MTAHPINASRPLAWKDYKILLLAALGGALEFYDFIIFVFFAGVISQLFFPPDTPEWLRMLQTFGIFAAGYVVRPAGGIIMAHFGDRFGRKRVFTLSIMMMAVPTLLIGLLPTYATIGLAAPLLLLLMRLFQGAAVGGEVPGAWVYVSEHVSAGRTGFACGTLTAGLTIGILLGSLIAGALNSFYTPQEIAGFAWRLPFLLGGILGLCAMRLRRWLHETPVFAEMQAHRAATGGMPIKAVLRDHRREVAVSVVLTWMLSAGILVLILMTPSILQKVYKIDAQAALLANTVATLCLAVGCIAAGLIADKFGTRRVLVAGSALLAVGTWFFYTTIATHPDWLLPLYGVLGLLVGVVGVVPSAMVQAFPTAVRFSGVSFAYNLSYAVFGGVTPIAVAWMLKYDALAPAWYVMAVCLIGMVGAGLLKRSANRAGDPGLHQHAAHS
jgi:MFS family permease